MQQKSLEIFLIFFAAFYFIFATFLVATIRRENVKEVRNENLVELKSLKNLKFDESFLKRNKNKNIFFVDGFPSDVRNFSDVMTACGVESAGK